MKSLVNGLNFLKATYQEAKLIVWPAPQEISRQFVIVVAISSLIVLALFTMDHSFSSVIKYIKDLV